MKLSETGIKNLALALSKFQEEVRNPSNTATNPQFRSKYAPLDVVINTVKPVLAKNGLSFLQSTGSEGENILVTTLLIHESGEWIESDPLVLPAYQIKSGGAKEFNAQGAGSSLTYARRYSLSAILGLSSEDDDDANGQVFGDSRGSAGAQSGTSATKPNARDEAKAKALKDAEAKKAAAAAKAAETEGPATTPATDGLPFPEQSTATEASTSSDVVEPANAAQIKAIGNMAKMIVKKRGGTEEAIIAEQVAKFGKASLEDLTFEEAKQLVPLMNAAMR